MGDIVVGQGIGVGNGMSVGGRGAFLRALNALLFLLRDDFITARAAGQFDAEVGTLTMHQVDGQFSVSGGKFNYPVQATPAWGDQGFYDDGLSRLAGRALVAKLVTSKANMGFGWNDHPTAFDDPRGFDNAFLITDKIIAMGTAVSPVGVGAESFDALTEYSYAIVLRGTGAFYFVKGGAFTQWTLTWIADFGATATVYAGMTNYDSAGAFDSFRTLDLPAPFATDYGIATQRLAGVRAEGDIFTHEANCHIEWTQTTRPAPGSTVVNFRIQDANNHWMVEVDQNAGFSLLKKVAGVTTRVATAASVMVNGHRCVIVANGTTIHGYSGNVLRWTYSTATEFATFTAGELQFLGTSGAVSDIVTWPRQLSGAAGTLLDSALDPNSTDTFSLRADFSTDEAAPLGGIRNTEPGPGQLTLVQNDGQFSVSGGALNFPAQATAAWGDQSFVSKSGIPATAGTALVASLSFTATSGYGWIGFNDDITPGDSGAVNAHGLRFDHAYGLVVMANGELPTVGSALAAATIYNVAVIRRTNGIIVGIKGGIYTDWTLLWIGNAGNALGFPAFSNHSRAGALDTLRVLDLAAPFNTEYGLSTQRLAGARAVNDTFSHEADCVIEWIQTGLGGAGMYVDFRRQDNNNKWSININNVGDLRLYEAVAGVYTERALASGVVAAGNRVVIVCDGTTIRGYSNNILRWTYSTASNFVSVTLGVVSMLDGTSAISDIISWPRTLSAQVAALLDEAIV